MNGSYVNGVTEHHPVNGVTPEATGPQTLHSQDHIALLLLSQVLDDESVVNFTNFDESNACFEGMSFPGSASAGQGYVTVYLLFFFTSWLECCASVFPFYCILGN